MNEIKILSQSIEACPSQWLLLLPDGSPGYINYRWGTMALKPVTERAGCLQEPIISEQIGDDYDGMCSLNTVVEWLNKQGYTVSFSDELKNPY